ncbi:Phosphatidylinositide phosphatase SAC1 [Nosema bombycis CQ1]|uniref:Phosphatidylinositide phosphatase SAC1 n=1 Tax=Nosema bombycis (strain CQ1 / CVCC 102059) TaxID=578461 RepID=R0M9H8_NOSB1|nr:Phosphatidylinositide phosphatase SAC1 [Nosema bombycis CQ1]|eukprot:EOB14639.1 Phosphatidylinositide phosphatase SAC1 [Nosema bombycis CQ1]
MGMSDLTITVKNNKVKIIDKNKTEVTIETVSDIEEKTTTSQGLYGVVVIENCKYLIYITEISKMQDFEGKQVFEICNVGILNLSGSSNHRTELNDLVNFFKIPGMYYSSYPLYKETSIGKSNGDDFIFNFAPLKEMEKLNPELKQFGVKCIQGFYGVENVKGIDYYLISRRSWRRTGARFFSRGSSPDGYVSNYVESEVFFKTNNTKMSYLQVRGSIPLYWYHDVMLNYTPKLVIRQKNNFAKCDAIIRNKYQDILYLNLIKDKNYEKPLYDKFNIVLKEKSCEIVNFDLNSTGSFQNKRTVFDFNMKTKKYIDEFGFKTLEDQQKGVIRTNCIDCLDRTNLSQFQISEEIIKKMCDYAKIPLYNEILKSNRRLWLNNGNHLSIQYSGTGAIKSYIVEGTCSSWSGNLKDFYKSISRYFINRYTHGRLQDTYDILTGKNLIKRKRYPRTKLFTPRQLAFIGILVGLLTISSFMKSKGKVLSVFKTSIICFVLLLLMMSLMRNYPKFDDD